MPALQLSEALDFTNDRTRVGAQRAAALSSVTVLRTQGFSQRLGPAGHHVY